MDWNEISHDQCHRRDPSGASKMISEPMFRSAQTVHLSCVKISSMSKQTKTTIHVCLVTKEYHQVRPKWFLSLWYVRRKPCTYLASRLALSLNRLKQVTTWASSTRSTIGCIPTWFLIYVWRKPCTYLALNLKCLQIYWNEIPNDQCRWEDPSGASKMISEPMVRSVQTIHLSCVKISTISKQTKTSIHLCLVT
jgi:hypothetical protein